jgi:ankyrin repeat protein
MYLLAGEPVALALRDHKLERMRELLDDRPDLVGKGDKRSNQPIHWATMTRQLDAIDELLRRGADINAERMDGGRPIHRPTATTSIAAGGMCHATGP